MEDDLLQTIDDFELLKVDQPSKFTPPLTDMDILERRFQVGLESPMMKRRQERQAIEPSEFDQISEYKYLFHKGQPVPDDPLLNDRIIAQFKTPAGYLLVSETATEGWARAVPLGRRYERFAYYRIVVLNEALEMYEYTDIDISHIGWQWAAKRNKADNMGEFYTEDFSMLKSIERKSADTYTIRLIGREYLKIRWFRWGPQRFPFNTIRARSYVRAPVSSGRTWQRGGAGRSYVVTQPWWRIPNVIEIIG